jgi:hypothetical protein
MTSTPQNADDVTHLGAEQLGGHRPLTAGELSVLLEDSPFRWGLCGGLAIDQFVGHPIRPHADVDIAVFREDEVLMRTRLASWEFWAAHEPGRGLDLLPSTQSIASDVHAIWCREKGTDMWSLEVLIEEGSERDWTYRRDARIRRPASEVFWRAGQIPVMRPEIVLLYKSKDPRENDRLDLDASLPKLDATAREWLRNAVFAAHPSSPWVALI